MAGIWHRPPGVVTFDWWDLCSPGRVSDCSSSSVLAYANAAAAEAGGDHRDPKGSVLLSAPGRSCASSKARASTR